ncbi:MerR family transcriptional regulator [Polyangium fumosum]|uniref:MerR family transcriptional regulator n=1 Tax=Polyangium fumosum TaxID=889272 RepID=A0A4U1JH58_9BACT|nr:MerR family transcriptional regulator [Polyangium fumosum]TKD11914.1 MerR family transcriptional regulator [Polyangium fumosum]
MAAGERKDKGAKKRAWKVGELAKATGTSIRTLHWYDEIGLLSPSDHSRAGYRLYGEGDVARLQQILSLRQLGMSLDEIRALLARPDVSPLSIVHMHITRLQEQMELTRKLLGRLEALAAWFAKSERVSADELLKTIEVMNMIEKYYTKEQLAELEARRQAFGEEAMQAVQAEWPALIAKVRAEMEKGTPPEDPAVQALAGRWMELVEMFTGGNPEIRRSLETMYKNEPGLAAQQGHDPALYDYVRRAQAARKRGTSA